MAGKWKKKGLAEEKNLFPANRLLFLKKTNRWTLANLSGTPMVTTEERKTKEYRIKGSGGHHVRSVQVELGWFSEENLHLAVQEGRRPVVSGVRTLGNPERAGFVVEREVLDQRRVRFLLVALSECDAGRTAFHEIIGSVHAGEIQMALESIRRVLRFVRGGLRRGGQQKRQTRAGRVGEDAEPIESAGIRLRPRQSRRALAACGRILLAERSLDPGGRHAQRIQFRLPARGRRIVFRCQQNAGRYRVRRG